jgi:7,8-dihydropterin-6-yl-methyl-4-(beta-D-ribofuranosyl)aminobenzene 5'-phosphate synthase
VIRITTLIENSPGEHLALKHEHGLSFCIETGTHKVLFDTGQSGQFLKNARQLKIDLTNLDCVVLSHGHYDHSGGFTHLADALGTSGIPDIPDALGTSGIPDAPVTFKLIVGPGFFHDKYARVNGGYEFLGNNFTPRYLEERGIPYSELDEPAREIVPGVHVLGYFPRIHPDEVINPRFTLLKNGQFEPDHFDDEILVAVDTPKGIVVLLGCSHPGMRNMLDAVKNHFEKPLYAVIGGTHLVEAAAGTVHEASVYLEHEHIDIVGVSHCTGKVGMKELSKNTESYFHNRTGSSLIISQADDAAEPMV